MYMKKLILYLVLLLPFLGYTQEVDIYSKWTAIIEDDVQLILDLSNDYYIGVKKIKVIDKGHHKIDSFGYKRKFNVIYNDLDSSTIFWTGSLTPLHPSIDPEIRLGIIHIVGTNPSGVPNKIKFSGDLPELSIYLDDEDFILFTRMNTNNRKTPNK